MRPHHNLEAWKEAMALVKAVYEATASFPREELFGLAAQMRRAAVSIPSNIAEGAARQGEREFLQFVSVAEGSLSELETQVLIAQDIGFIHDTTALVSKIDRLSLLLSGLRRHLRQRVSA